MPRIVLAAALLLLGAEAACADDFKTCATGAPDYAIMACTNLIEGGKLDTRQQAIAYSNRGMVFRIRGGLQRALADFNRAIELEPQSPDAFAGRAQANLKKGLAAEALPDIDRALSLDSNDPFARDTRGHILAALGRRKEAIAEYKKAFAIKPDLRESVDGSNALQRGKP